MVRCKTESAQTNDENPNSEAFILYFRFSKRRIFYAQNNVMNQVSKRKGKHEKEYRGIQNMKVKQGIISRKLAD
jgi:hypothetical protein